MVIRTWETREVPLLEAVVNAYEEGPPLRDSVQLAKVARIAHEAVLRAIPLLIQAGYVRAQEVGGLGASRRFGSIYPTPKAHRMLGAWPGDPFDEALLVLEQRIAAESDPARRTKLQRFRDAFEDIGKGVATSVLSDIARRSIGG